jgi:hypothetical protein
MLSDLFLEKAVIFLFIVLGKSVYNMSKLYPHPIYTTFHAVPWSLCQSVEIGLVTGVCRIEKWYSNWWGRVNLFLFQDSQGSHASHPRNRPAFL